MCRAPHAALLLLLLGVACARQARPPERGGGGADFLGEGLASFYGPGLYGHRTANGEVLGRSGYTAAHRSLRFGACVRVVNVTNGRAVNVRVNDRGPYVSGRIMDVSLQAADALGLREKGVAHVRLYRCGSGEAPRSDMTATVGELLVAVAPESSREVWSWR